MNLYELKNDIYIYDTPIGYGSFSILYKGFNYKLLKYIAVKQVNKIPDIKYMENEVNLMKTLSHPNVLKLYDVYLNKNKVYMIIDYCTSDLKRYITSKENAYDKKYFIEIISGICYINKQKIIHRDIKPENILIKDNTIKICDFGMSKTYGKYDLLSTFCGSPLYMAPEIIKNKKYNNQSDIWSLGVVLYELICKIHPYYCSDKEELWELVKNDQITIDFNIINNDIYRSIIKNMLITNLSKRIKWSEIHDMELENKEPCLDDEIFQIDTDSTNEFNMINNLDKEFLNTELTSSDFVKQHINTTSSQSLLINNPISINQHIISNSDPVMKGKYFEKYLSDYKSDIDEENNGNIPLYGSSPTRKGGLNNILDKSYDKIKYFFKK